MSPSAAGLHEHFEQEHALHDDPWSVTSRWYEIRKRAITLASLPDEHYGQVLEVGCSIGVLTEELARRVDRVLAVDVAESALSRARERLAPLTHVEVARVDVGEGLPPGPWDLIVLSEVAYYLSRDRLSDLVSRIEEQLAPTGVLLACHWRRDEPDFVQTGDAVHRLIAFESMLSRLVHHEEADFVLDVFGVDDRSVARRTGIV
ncbi:class I SAM-dependent methyltransferase [Frondihabitans australicus]|uniref:Nodulation protein S (NodS) n=1 Tax=Frondihabitans australicus TaxID=386892 RepID=A0A495IIB1_9MICO|nr:SAM-dependent methyltransferase [Frondihabitans australicus]RKR74846.1 nodulation protein S (NodS) [Frondihabitans australicus]